MNRFAEAKAVREKQIDRQHGQQLPTIADLYTLAFIEGDTAAMQRQVDWAKGKPDEFVFLQVVAEAAASRGKLQAPRKLRQGGRDCAPGEVR